MIRGIKRRSKAGGFIVAVGDRQLDPKPSQKLVNHSTDGFAWGYGGSGPAQLALALLLHFSTRKFALANYQDFKWEVIAKLPQDDFMIADTVVSEWIRKRRGQGGGHE